MTTANPRYGSQVHHATCKHCDKPISRRVKTEPWRHVGTYSTECERTR